MTRILATADGEFRIALRNRWVAIALVLMAVFSLVLSLAGSAPSGDSGRTGFRSRSPRSPRSRSIWCRSSLS